MKKRNLSFLEIWNMSFGFLGIQMGFALQNANASRILQIFGADVHELSWFWIIAPIMGLVVQPIIGHFSDKTWGKFGRRKPFFLLGSILASIGLILMPNAYMFTAIIPALWVGAGFLMIMDASFNVAMEPFRALVADNLNEKQRTLGFSVQTALIGFGAVIGSWLPYVLTQYLGITNEAKTGEVPMNLIYSFVIGAIILIGSVLITIFTTKEYTPEELKSFDESEDFIKAVGADEIPDYSESKSIQPENKNFIASIIEDFGKMPKTMKQLSWVQFFSWFGLFGMWVYSTPAIATHVYGLAPSDTHSKTYQDAGDWVGILFGIYNFVSAIYAFLLPIIAKKIGKKATHATSLIIGGISLISIYFIHDRNILIIPMIGVGIAWASILAMPYAILSNAINPKKMGVYMGIFNFFIVLPQIVNALIGGPMVKYIYADNTIYALVSSGISFLIAAVLVSKIKESKQ